MKPKWNGSNTKWDRSYRKKVIAEVNKNMEKAKEVKSKKTEEKE